MEELFLAPMKKDIVFAKTKKILNIHRVYYKKIKGVDISSLRNFNDIPLLTRKDLIEINDFSKAKDIFFATMTSGSKDEAFYILRNKQAFAKHLLRQKKIYQAIRLKNSDRFINLLSYSMNGAARIIDEALRSLGICSIPVGSIKNQEGLNFAVKVIKELKPIVIQSYVNEAFDIFSLLGRRHSIKKCVLTGEYLSEKFRQDIARMSGVEVYNNYGSMEFSGFAISESPKDKFMRLFEDGLYIEIMDNNGRLSDTGCGQIVITDLENTAMPFVRYVLGDIVEIIRRKNKKYVRVSGRAEDSIAIDGEAYSKASVIDAITESLGHPNFFMIVDKNILSAKDVLYLNLPSVKKTENERIINTIKKKFSFFHVLKIRTYKGDIPRTSTGKYKHIIDLRK